jgi:hypothetical protein
MPRTKDTDFFLKNLRGLDGSAGNKTLREKLKWADEKYFRVRQALIEEGLVDIGKGKGGSVYILGDSPTEIDISVDVPRVFNAEIDHYPLVVSKIEKQLKQDYRDAVVEQTAHKGGMVTGGKWSRPDILAVTFQRFEYVAHDEFILRSYEIKRSDVVDTDAVAEAVAHRRLVELAYLVVVPHGGAITIFDPTNSKRRKVERECLRAGIGLIFVPDYDETSEMDFSIEAVSSNIDYREVNSTIGLLFTEAKRNEIRELIKISRRGELQKLL